MTGFFTDMAFIAQEAEWTGTEVWIVYTGGTRYYATVQMASSWPGIPVVVPVEVSGSRVKFTVTQPLVDQDGKPAPDFVVRFDGIVTRAGLSGTANSNPLNLKRRESFWQKN